MRSLYLRLTGRSTRGKRSIPLQQRPLPSWPPPADPWLSGQDTQIIPRIPQQYRPEVNR